MATKANEKLLSCSMVGTLAKSTEEQCKFVIDNECLEGEATVDYVHLVFCKIELDMRLLATTLVIFLVIMLFLNLSAVADEFLCPSLLRVAKSLRMSDSLAGVTLLAFGNGCPDIFASLAAAGRSELIVGQLLGAGIFCSSIVAGLILIKNDFKIARRPILRDTWFYLLAVYLIWSFCSQGRVTFYGALAFIVIYVIYLLTALVGQALHSRSRGEYPIAATGPAQAKEKTQTAALDEDEATSDTVTSYRQLEELMRRRSSGVLPRKSSLTDRTDAKVDKGSTMQMSKVIPIQLPVVNISSSNLEEKDDRITADRRNNNVIEIVNNLNREMEMYRTCPFNSSPPTSTSPKTEKSRPLEINNKTPKQLGSKHEVTLVDSLSTTQKDVKRLNFDDLDIFLSQISPIDKIDWNQSNLFTKIMALMRAPLWLLTTLTVPVVDGDKPNDNWCRLLNSIHCFTIPLVVVALTRDGSSWRWFLPGHLQGDDGLRKMTSNNTNSDDLIINSQPDASYVQDDVLIPYFQCLALVPGLALALYVFNTTSATRPPRYHSIFAFFGFIMSVVWIYKLANEIISLLKTIGLIFSMSDTAIGLGFLAWGNSLGDIAANLTLAQAGYARMALGASIGAPLLNLLLGFGLSFTISLKPGESATIEYSKTITLLAGTLALVLILLMASTAMTKHRSKKLFGYLLIFCYGLYFILAVCLETNIL